MKVRRTGAMILECLVLSPALAFAGGAGTNNVISLGAGHSYVWSPTGDKLVFVSGDSVFVYDMGAVSRTSLGKGAAPSWSPSGKNIAFRVNDRLLIWDARKGRAITSRIDTSFDFAWSDDQSLIALATETDASRSIEIGRASCRERV